MLENVSENGVLVVVELNRPKLLGKLFGDHFLADVGLMAGLATARFCTPVVHVPFLQLGGDPTATLAARQESTVGEPPLLRPGSALAVENAPNLLKQCPVDERFVGAPHQLPLVAHHPVVERVPEQVVDSAGHDPATLWITSVAARSEALPVEPLGEVLERPVACRVQLERFPDQRCPDRIGEDLGIDHRVPQGRLRGPHAFLQHSLVHAFTHFLAQVVEVVFGKEDPDSEGELSGSGIVVRLGDEAEFLPCSHEVVDVRVILEVPQQTVELVGDDAGNI
ncbi:MAG TPA: hypothetical protein VFM39_00800 [bacterium]|nr:hypothetical protein [bacterium]